ncbi:MAG: polysaccharide pyruvyl transferase family protein [Pseudomonadota bacterium]
MKKYDYLVCGYYGMKNTGDDALLLACWQILRRMHPQAKVAVTASHCEYGQPVLPARERFRGHRRLAMYRAAANSTSIIFGGGSTFHSKTDLQLKTHMLALAGDGPHMAVGVGIGPFTDEKTKSVCKRLLEQLAFVGVRDQQSYDLCKEMGLTNCRLTFDLAPSILPANLPSFWTHEKRAGIGVSLCPLEGLGKGNPQDERRRLDTIIQSLEAVAQTTGEPIVLLDFNGHDYWGDAKLHAEIQNRLSPEIEVRRYSYAAHPMEFFNRIRKLKCMVGMRLHAQVFSYLTQTPVIALNYHSKNEGWLDQIGHPEALRMDCRNLSAKKLFGLIAAGVCRGFPMPSKPVDEAVANSLNNWNYLYDLH